VHNLFLVYLSIPTCFRRLCAHHQEKNCVYATLGTCYSVWMTVWYAYQMSVCGWLSGIHTRQSSRKNNKHQVSHKHSFSPDDGHIIARNVYRLKNILRINILGINFPPIWLYLQEYTFRCSVDSFTKALFTHWILLQHIPAHLNVLVNTFKFV
jgi:hypothetical protein